MISLPLEQTTNNKQQTTNNQQQQQTTNNKQQTTQQQQINLLLPSDCYKTHQFLSKPSYFCSSCVTKRLTKALPTTTAIRTPSFNLLSLVRAGKCRNPPQRACQWLHANWLVNLAHRLSTWVRIPVTPVTLTR